MQVDREVLENRWVRLEPLTEAHRETLRPLAEEPGLWDLTIIRGDGPHFDAWFDLMLSGQAVGSQISHCVIDAVSGEPVGHSAFLSITPDHKRLEIGWTWYVRAARGTRINPGAKHALLSRAFGCGAERVELRTHHRNLHSQNAMLKLGAKPEGVFRKHLLCWSGEWRHTHWFSILREEWPGVEAGLAARLS